MQGGITQTAAEIIFSEVFTQLSVSSSTLLIVCGIELMPREQTVVKKKSLITLFILELCHCHHQETRVKENALSAFLSKYFDMSITLC